VPQFFANLAAPVEFICGVGVIFGIATGYAALLMLVFTIVATGISHRYWQYTDPAQFRNQSSNFWKNVSMMGGMLLLFVTAAVDFPWTACSSGIVIRLPTQDDCSLAAHLHHLGTAGEPSVSRLNEGPRPRRGGRTPHRPQDDVDPDVCASSSGPLHLAPPLHRRYFQ
jgi:hypothetical protein